jgi:hypothetical protein
MVWGNPSRNRVCAARTKWWGAEEEIVATQCSGRARPWHFADHAHAAGRHTLAHSFITRAFARIFLAHTVRACARSCRPRARTQALFVLVMVVFGGEVVTLHEALGYAVSLLFFCLYNYLEMVESPSSSPPPSVAAGAAASAAKSAAGGTQMVSVAAASADNNDNEDGSNDNDETRSLLSGGEASRPRAPTA